MNLSEIFIRRPVMTTLLMIGILIFGLMSYVLLPISDLPSVDYPTIQVSASLPGATPETMAASVATPLEKQFSSIAGLDSMNSTSGVGTTSITLQFNLNRKITDAAKDVQGAISAAGGQLPPMPKLPTYRKVNPSAAPILYLYLYSKSVPIYTVDEYAEITVGQAVSIVDGVAQVQVYGQKQYAARVQLDPQAMASRGVGIDQVNTAIQAANVDLPTGILSGKYKSYFIEADGQLKNAAGYNSLIVSYQNGAPVRLQDIGQVSDSVINDQSSNYFNGTPAVVLAIQRQPNTNTVEIVDTIKKLLPTLRLQVPPAIEMGIFYDRSESIRASVDDVKFTMLLTIALVVLVIFLFLRNLSATLIPSLALPIALIGTFAVMYVLGFSLDNLSLMALTLSVGFVVDDAVVVLENIVRHREMGEGLFEAALNGSREISFTIVSMTLSLVAVFIPMLFMGGLLGRLFHEFAVTIAVAILVSGFVSLSLTPMLCSRFLRPPAHENSNRLYQASEWFFDSLLKGYTSSLKLVLKYHLVTLVGSIVLLFLTFYLFTVVNKGLIPSQDSGQIMANTKAAQDISYEDMLAHQQKVVEIIRKQPGVQYVNSTVGASGPNASVNAGRIIIRLKPLNQRSLSSDQIIQKLRPKVAKIPGIRVLMQSPPAIPIGGQQTNSIYQFSLQTLDSRTLAQYVPKLEAKIKTIKGLQDVDSTLELSSPQVQVNIDRNKASTLGINASEVESVLSDAYGSGQVSLIYTSTDQFEVILELLPQYRRDVNALSLLYVRSSSGSMVPLSAIAHLVQNVGPLSVSHLGEIASATISYNLAPGTSLEQANKAISDAATSILPSTITTSFQGSAKVFAQSFSDLGLLLALSIIVIYLILGVLYEDFIHPLTILSGLPSAGFGALLTLLIFDVELNVYSFIGIILLIGIVKKNGIMMVDFAIETQRKERKSSYDAIYEACLVRFRPIMMTTMAALMGTLPIALGLGAGSETRRPLGIAVVGGLVFSQVLTLYLTPVFYLYMEGLRKFLSRGNSAKKNGVNLPIERL